MQAGSLGPSKLVYCRVQPPEGRGRVWGSRMRTRWRWGRVPVQPWDLSLPSDLISPGLQRRRWCVNFPVKMLVFCGEVKCGLALSGCGHYFWPGPGVGELEGTHYGTEHVQKGLVGFVGLCVPGFTI